MMRIRCDVRTFERLAGKHTDVTNPDAVLWSRVAYLNPASEEGEVRGVVVYMTNKTF